MNNFENILIEYKKYNDECNYYSDVISDLQDNYSYEEIKNDEDLLYEYRDAIIQTEYAFRKIERIKNKIKDLYEIIINEKEMEK